MGNELPRLRTLTPKGLLNFIRESSEWSLKITKGVPEKKWSLDGRPHFGAGRSGDEMRLAVIKQGAKCQTQIDYLQRLRQVVPTERLPEIYAQWGDGYAMEILDKIVATVWWPNIVENVLQSFWDQRSVVPDDTGAWKKELFDTLDIMVPDWAHFGIMRCATHGDATLCNTMQRQKNGWVSIVLVDPVRPERTPSIRYTDQARIVQSMLGWDIMNGCQTQLINWNMPRFVYDDNLRVALYWTMVVMARIAASARATEIEKTWAGHLKSEIEGVVL